MERQQGDNFAGECSHPGILDKNCICTNRIEPDKIFGNAFQFMVMDEGVYCYVDPDIPAVGIIDCFFNFRIGKIRGEFPGAKPFPAQVYGIRTGSNRCPECLR
jgi:hypothetical protein